MYGSKFIRLLMIFAMLLAVCSCKKEEKKSISTPSVSFTHEGDLFIYQGTTDSIKASFNIEFAESSYETQTGLMYRKGMENDQAMLFIFPTEAMHSFYMKNTEFPLDILYIDEDLNLASMQENAQPLDEDGLSSIVPVKYVLEINGGLAEVLNISIGDSISYSRK